MIIDKDQLALVANMGSDKAASIIAVCPTMEELAGYDPNTLGIIASLDNNVAKAVVAWAQARMQAGGVEGMSVTVDLTGQPAASSTPDTPSELFGGIQNLLRGAQEAVKKTYDLEAIQRFAQLLTVYAYEVAEIDDFVLRALQQGAGRHVRDNWVLEVADRYRTNKQNATQVPVAASPERNIPTGYNLEIVPDQARVKYWEEVTTALQRSGFYTLIEQLAFWQRAAGKSAALSQMSQVFSTISDARYDPDQMRRLHEDVLSEISIFMQDRTRVLTAQRIMNEYNVAVLQIMQDPDVLYSLCNPPRDTHDVWAYFWNTDQVDLYLERAGLRLGTMIYNAIIALAQYDASQPYETQIQKFSPAANDAYTVFKETGNIILQRYHDRISQPECTGVQAYVQTMSAAISLRVNAQVGNATVKVGVSTQTTTQQTFLAPRGTGSPSPTNYEYGFSRLEASSFPGWQEILVIISRMRKAIHNSKIYGGNLSDDFWRDMGSLNKCTLEFFKCSFADICNGYVTRTPNFSQEDVRDQMERLETHRGTLEHLLQQEAIHGTPYSPPSIAHGIKKARFEITRIKNILQNWGVQIEDHPND